MERSVRGIYLVAMMAIEMKGNAIESEEKTGASSFIWTASLVRVVLIRLFK